MIKVYDKAQWHIDAGENADSVIDRLTALFRFLDEKSLLTGEGKEILDLGIDSSVSIHERMVTEKGKMFMEECYDNVIDKRADEMIEALEREYKSFG